MSHPQPFIVADLSDRGVEAEVTHPTTQCDCPDWNPGVDKLNGPIITAQLRSGRVLPSNYFIAWNYCPWCAKPLAAAPPKSAVKNSDGAA